jgi:hypothetical protein
MWWRTLTIVITLFLIRMPRCKNMCDLYKHNVFIGIHFARISYLNVWLWINPTCLLIYLWLCAHVYTICIFTGLVSRGWCNKSSTRCRRLVWIIGVVNCKPVSTFLSRRYHANTTVSSHDTYPYAGCITPEVLDDRSINPSPDPDQDNVYCPECGWISTSRFTPDRLPCKSVY